MNYYFDENNLLSERLNAAFTAQTIEEIPAQNAATVEYIKFGFGLAPQEQKD